MEKIFIYKSISGDTLGSRTDITSKSGMYAIAADLIARPEIDCVYCSSQQDKQDLVNVINDVNANGLSEMSYSSHNINVNIICDESIFKDTEYKKIRFISDIDDAYEKLHKYYLTGEKACCEFQGKTLYSDKCNHPDYVYKVAFNQTKAEFDAEVEESRKAFAERMKQRKEREELFKKNRPEIIKNYIESGKKVLKEEAWKDWEKSVKEDIQSTGDEYVYSLALTSLRSLKRGTSYEDMSHKLYTKTGREYYPVIRTVEKFMDYIKYPEKTKSKEKELDQSQKNDFIFNENGNLLHYVGKEKNVVMPDYSTGIGYCAFYNRTSLTSVIISDSITEISDAAFYNCSSLTSMIIPESVKSLGEKVFYGCESLKSIIFEGNPKLDREVFEGCCPKEIIVHNEEMKQYLIENVDLPAGCEIKVVEKELDKDDKTTDLEEINYEENIESDENGVFENYNVALDPEIDIKALQAECDAIKNGEDNKDDIEYSAVPNNKDDYEIEKE